MPGDAPHRGKSAPSRDSGSDVSGRTWQRGLALLAGLALLSSFLSVLWAITDVVGGSRWLVLGVVAAFLVATVAGRFVPLPIGIVVGILLFSAGVVGYLDVIPDAYESLVEHRFTEDVVALLVGDLSVLQVDRADVWAIAIAPAPVFATWYLVVRRRYALAAWVGGLTLGFFVLTGDAGESVALYGVTCALAVLGFGTLDEMRAPWDHARKVGLVLAATVVGTRLLRPVTTRALSSIDGVSPTRGTDGAGGNDRPSTVEAGLLDASGRVDVVGSISLSPAVRFEMTADRPGYWHVDSYDRYVGDGWVRSGESTPYDGRLPGPPGTSESVAQRVVPATTMDTIPALWRPVELGSAVADESLVTSLGGFDLSRPLVAGDGVEVTSERPIWTEATLAESTESAPQRIRDRYLQLPNSTPDRLGEFTRDLTADVEGRYDVARTIERWLEREKRYSLDVRRPGGDVASSFVFEMARGYCVYFATAMVTMLRTVDVPARFAVGYTTGQQVEDGRWVVRGFNAHAWVEVFFPGVGWVTFDPTPGGPRQRARRERLTDARGAGEPGVDTSETRPATPTPSPTAKSEPSESVTPGDGGSTATETPSATDDTNSPTETTPTASATEAPTAEVDQRSGAVADTTLSADTGNGTSVAATPSPTDEGGGPIDRRALFTRLSGTDQLTLLAAVVGVAIGVDRLHLLRRGYRFVRLNWQPASGAPETDIRRAFDRLETVLARRFRERRDGETRRAFLEAVQAEQGPDPRLERVLTIYERSEYSGESSPALADEARRLVDELVREETLGRFGGNRRE